jgi:hypothetical protein
MTDGGTPLVLVADDEEDIRALVAFGLKRARDTRSSPRPTAQKR